MNSRFPELSGWRNNLRHLVLFPLPPCIRIYQTRLFATRRGSGIARCYAGSPEDVNISRLIHAILPDIKIYTGGTIILWRNTISTVEDIQQCGGYIVLWRYSGRWGYLVLWREFSTVAESNQCCGGSSVMWWDTISTVEDIKCCGWIPPALVVV